MKNKKQMNGKRDKQGVVMGDIHAAEKYEYIQPERTRPDRAHNACVLYFKQYGPLVENGVKKIATNVFRDMIIADAMMHEPSDRAGDYRANGDAIGNHSGGLGLETVVENHKKLVLINENNFKKCLHKLQAGLHSIKIGIKHFRVVDGELVS